MKKDEIIRLRISKEEKEAFKQYCQNNGLGNISQVLRTYMNQCVGGK